MNQILIRQRTEFEEKVFQEYVDTSQTMLLRTNYFITYVPHLFDLVNALPDVPWDAAMHQIMDVVRDNQLFIRYESEYFYKPMQEVW